MPQYWTVEEAVSFNAELKMAQVQALTAEQRQLVRDMQMAAFGLHSVAKTYIGGPNVRGCSGGQRRRVTLMRGVMQGAWIMFCDEPTSGLSATDAELCIKALKIIAKRVNILILVVIHQPRVEVADLFDWLILLTARPGRTMYSGPMKDAVHYWESCGHPIPRYGNPTDVFLDMVTPDGADDHVAEFEQHFKEKLKPGIDALVNQKCQEKGMTPADLLRSSYQMQVKLGLHPAQIRLCPIAAPFHKQVWLLLKTKLVLKRRNPSAIVAALVVPIVMGSILGCFYQGTGDKLFFAQASFLSSLLMQLAMAGNQMIPSLIADRHIMKYDTSEQLYSTEAYILVNLLVEVSLSFVGAFLRVFVMFAISGVHWRYFGIILAWGVSLFWFFDSFFACLAAFCKDAQTATTMSMPFTVVFIFFNGFMLTPKTAPSWLKWIFSISPMFYALQSVMEHMAPDFVASGAILDQSGFQNGQDPQGFLIIYGLSIILRVGQAVCLKYKNNIAR